MKNQTLHEFLVLNFILIGMGIGICSIIISIIVLNILDDVCILNSARFFWITVTIWFGDFIPIIANYYKIERKLKRRFYKHALKQN